ncbi:MAG: primosomal protein N' [Deferribacteraceae bacterium]|nr:primosomal protein N' [Deferribacteraceae bacterium]
MKYIISERHYIDVLLPVATEGVYTYRSEENVAIGRRVLVPLGKRNVMGISLGAVDKPDFECRDILSAPDSLPIFPVIWIDFIKKLANYYITSLGQTFHGVISSKVIASEPPEDEFNRETFPLIPLELTEEQRFITEKIPLTGFSVHLIQGITGSGKTEIYLDLIKKVVAQGKQIMYLVPEIALTPQLIDRIKNRLGYLPAIYHSKLTDNKRNDSFWRFVNGEQPVLLGARSALFVPSSKLGLIIIDEEHENTFKQEESPSYHLRDMAVLYSRMNNIPVILGSATPQSESIANAKAGKYNLHFLKTRPGSSELPAIELVDIKKSSLVGGIMTEYMYDEVARTVSKGNQAILFLNRKGYATSLFCRDCGALQQCANCSVALTMYKNSGRCVCHYCGTEYKNLKCTECGSEEIVDAGFGTERVEELIEQMFPGKSLRLDTDKIKTFKQMNLLLEDFRKKKAQILIGTQLIAKGLHFPDVTYVGILGIDNILAIPDFRAVEKVYQLIMQVSGRAGRGESKGKVQIQTFMPDNPVFRYIKEEPEKFYEYELSRRQQFEYPPYVRMGRLIFSYSKEPELKTVTENVIIRLKNEYPEAVFYGPAKAVIYKIKNRYRLSVIIKCKTNKYLDELLYQSGNLFGKFKTGTMTMKIDKDPYFFM